MARNQTTAPPTALKRIFLDWSRPALESVAEEILQRNRGNRFIDLSHLIVVFYGRQAGRRFLEILTEKSGGGLCPPQVVTVGQLPELLYTPQRPFASPLTQQLAWAKALQSFPVDRLKVFIRSAPEANDQAGWMRLGELLRKLHEELARDQLDFTDVWRIGASLDGFNETDRWKFLADVQQVYLRTLDRLELWDQQTARLEAIRRQEIQTDREIITVGTVDLNRTLRSMLNQIAGQVTTYIHSPPQWADNFDTHGCLVPEKWAEHHVDLKDAQILMADDPADQCSAVLTALASLNGRYALDDITIGMPDPRLVLPLQRTLSSYGVPSHWPVDRQLSSTGPYRFLQAVADWIEDPTADHFAALIRHPDVTAWLNSQDLPATWLTVWDHYFNEHLPRQLDRIIDGPDRPIVIRVKQAIANLLAPIPESTARLSDWATPVSTILNHLYGQQEIDAAKIDDSRLIEVCQQLTAAFESHAAIPSELDCSLSAPDAIRLTLSLADGELYRSESEPAVQLVGWLEMPLDDAPVAVVTTFNEGFVPTSVNHDLFLPNRLRAHLGIEDNARRYARDLYVLSVLVHSREELQLIVARRDDAHNPLAPSRLLFATSPEKIAQRILAFYEPGQSAPRKIPASPIAIAAEPNLPIPAPEPADLSEKVFRVTEFRDYLASPYRYYLRHILSLKELSDDVDELGGAAFGTLIHEVLQSFGSSDIAHSTNPEVIESFLHDHLAEILQNLYGDSPLAAITLQAEQARRRLTAFAIWQANWVSQGWQIHSIERSASEPIPFPLGDGRTILLKGRIDRIDRHLETGRWALFDYKTGEAGTSPEKSHRSGETWTDLQLPLYRHLAAAMGMTGDMQLGYIVLPQDTNAIRADFAEWSEDELNEADDVARDVARNILDQKFWKLLSHPVSTLREFDPICQTTVFGQEALL